MFLCRSSKNICILIFLSFFESNKFISEVSYLLRFLFRLLKIALVLILPFVLLVRSAVFVHMNYNPGGYLSLICGIGATVVLLTIYMTFIYEMFTNRLGRIKAFKNRMVFGLVILLGFCIQGLFFISTNNMKSSDLYEDISDLHPIGRVALNSVIVFDRDLIITDASRVPEDYRKMRLPTNKNSLHYRQKDGYSYAFDLRTRSRTWLHNMAVEYYFKILGFKTMRHVGTGDHLHVSLMCHYHPKSF